jgi:hypothetical protein
MLEAVYKAIWSRLGGRPWTYIVRDTWHMLEGIWIIGLVAAGAILGHWFWGLIFWFLLAFALGYVAGHLFWGTRYIPGQVAPARDQLTGKAA